MLEARLTQGSVLKKCLDAIKDLVNDGNFDCGENGITLQAMDNSHVALVNMNLQPAAFDPFRCDRNLSLGVNLASFTKILKCAGNDDIITLKADDEGDVLHLVFENNNGDRVSEFQVKLMDIDSEHLGIPETAYDSTVTMPSAEFQRIVRDMMILGESITIEVSKEGVRFSGQGDMGAGSTLLKQGASVDAEESVSIDMNSPVSLTFSLKYLNHFAKATPLSKQVTLSLSSDVPLSVDYKIGQAGFIKYYLAPKIGDEN